MTANYHTPISTGAAANASTINSPLSQLDTQVTAHNTEIVNARGSEASIDARLDESLNADGTIAANSITAQSQLNLSDAAAVNGDLVRYQEFTQEHAAGGGHSANIIDQNEINLTSAADATGEAVRQDEFSQEHGNDGAHSAGIIDQAELNLTTAGDATGEAVRQDEFAQEHNNNGTHRTDVGFITAQAQINLGDAGAVNGDATRYNEFTNEHNADGSHNISMVRRDVIYVDNQIGGGNGVEPSALPEYIYTDPGGSALSEEDKIQFVFPLAASEGANRIAVQCQCYRSGSGANAYLYLYADDESLAAYTEITAGSYTDVLLKLNISSLIGSDEVFIGDVKLAWDSDGPSVGFVYMRYVTVFLYKE
jgi:hypothetical protein